MPFPFDKYPWLNFQELNLAYFIKHFREIFQQWDSLLHEMYDWKDATDTELAEWRNTVETGISSWETGLQQSMEDWKDETEADITTWEEATLSALDAWKTATIAVFEQIRTEAAASAQAAAGSASSAQTAMTAAQNAQLAAEDAAAGIQSELTQIQTNTADISDLKTQMNFNGDGLSKFFRPSNLINPMECIDNAWVIASGSSMGNISLNHPGYMATNLIPVIPGSNYKANSQGRSYALYDVNKVCVSAGTGTDFNTNGITIPTDIYYIRYTIRKDIAYDNIENPYNIYFAIANDYDENLKIVPEHSKTAETAENAIILKNDYASETENLAKFLRKSNLINPALCVDNAYIHNSGAVRTNYPGYFCTGFIPVTAGETYKANSVGRNYAIYQSDYTMLIYGNGSDFNTNGILIPNDGAFIRYTIRKGADFDNIPTFYDAYFAKASEYDEEIDITVEKANSATLADNVKEWVYNKTINWCGDSIVDGRDFDEYVCENLGLIKLTQDGVDGGINGSTISLKSDGTDGRNAICVRYSNMPDNADIIAISAGTNDWMYAWAPIGDIDSVDNTTFYGAMKNLCEGLITKYPDKIIFFTTPIKRAQAFSNGAGGTYTPDDVMTTPFSKNRYGKTLNDYANIIKEVCGYYSIPVLDMYNESLLNPHISAQQYLFDSALTHPQQGGQKIMARRVSGWLKQLGYNIT